jgi:uncharacterized protein YkwD
MRNASLLAVFLVLPLLGCAGVTGPAAPQSAAAAVPQPPPPDPQTQMAALETRIMSLTDAQRLKLDPKAKKLTLDPELAHIARERASDMAAKNYLAHAAPNGDTSASLLMAQDAKFQGLLGENLAAQHYVKQSGVDVEAFAQRFLDEWIKSRPHRDNLAFADYDRTGVGAAVNGDTVYVAQLFAFTLATKTDRDPASEATQFPSAEAARSAGQNAATASQEPLRLRGAEGGGPD